MNSPRRLNIDFSVCRVADDCQPTGALSIMLDELLDPNTLYQPTATDAYAMSCASICCACRKMTKSNSLGAASVQTGAAVTHRRSGYRCTLPVMKVSDHLTWLAEAMIMPSFSRRGFKWWPATVSQITQRSRRPWFCGGRLRQAGRLELGYSSDLDLIFLHDCPMDA